MPRRLEGSSPPEQGIHHPSPPQSWPILTVGSFVGTLGKNRYHLIAVARLSQPVENACLTSL